MAHAERPDSSVQLIGPVRPREIDDRDLDVGGIASDVLAVLAEDADLVSDLDVGQVEEVAGIGPASDERKRSALPAGAAGTAQLEPPCGDGWLAAGDAAASFDPLSSLGILTAVLMGAEAARCVDDPATFAARYRAITAHHETEREATYRREERWPNAPFWARRHRAARPDRAHGPCRRMRRLATPGGHRGASGDDELGLRRVIDDLAVVLRPFEVEVRQDPVEPRR